MIQEQELIYKCKCQRESEVYICISQDCKLSPVCCKLCLKEYHEQHESISVNEVRKIESLQLSQTYSLIQQIENQINRVKSLLHQIDVLKQLQEKPSLMVLKSISWMMKDNVNYKDIKGVLSDHAKLVNNSLEEMMNYIKGFQTHNSKYFVDITELYQIGKNLYLQNRFTEAIEQLDRILEIDREHQQALFFKSLSLFNSQRYEEAIEYANKVIENNSQNTDILYTKSYSLFKLKKYNEALIVLNKLLEISPTYPYASSLKGTKLQYSQRSNDTENKQLMMSQK